MFEFTFQDADQLQGYIRKKKVDQNAIYDFTFESQYLIYHYPIKHEFHYTALDMQTGYGSHIVTKKKKDAYRLETYRNMIPKILYSIKYTSDGRYLKDFNFTPEMTVNFIFRTVLPYHGYKVREEQIKLSFQMLEGFRNKWVSINEAEVGTGKSLAYLIAAFVAKTQFAKSIANPCPITITTSSIELQNALVEKEIPNLSRMLKAFGLIDQPLKVVLRKGKEHYLCPMRYREYLKQIKDQEKYRALVAQFEKLHLKDKALTDLDKLDLRVSVKDKICVKGNCKDCKHAEHCGYADFIRHAQKDTDIDFQVTNHNLYLAHTKLCNAAKNAPTILQPSYYVIIDEAHKLKQAAEDTFGERFSEKEVANYVKAAWNACAEQSNLTRYRDVLNELKDTNKKVFSYLREQMHEDDYENEGHTIITDPLHVQVMLYDIVHQIDESESYRAKTDSAFDRKIAMLADTVYSIADSYSKETNYWVEVDENDVASFCCSPIHINEILYEKLWNQKSSHVLTSGTMSDGTDFDFFKCENGIDRVNSCKVQESSTPSPFDYRNHARLYIPKGMPQPDNEDETYHQAVAEQIIQIVDATNGHTAILFTSYAVLQTVYELIKDKLDRYEVICMTRSNRTAIADFKKSVNAVLFASGSMWEGVDCAGDCLSSVIIVRLPFPLRSATMEQKKSNCTDVGEFVQKYAVPEMIIKLRQGVGRLIRNETDTGLIAILDVRADEGKHAVRVRKVLRKYPLVNSPEEIRKFFHTVKSPAYFEGSAKQ